MAGGSGQRGATIGQLQAATDGNCDRMRQILRDPSLAPRKREGYINAMRNLGCDTAVMTTVAMGAAGGAFGGLGHGLAITANTWTFGLISPLDSHAEGLQDAYGHLAEYRMAAGAAEFGREAAIAALTGGAGNVALRAGRFAAAARGVYAAGQVYNGVQVGQGLYAAAGAFSQGNVLQGVLLGVTSGVGLPGPRIVGPGLQRGVASGPLDWSRVNWKGETAWEHVQRHGQAAPNRKLHGTFTDDAVLTTEEAWSRAQRLGMSPHIEGNGAGVLSVPMGRAIGRETGWGQAGRPTSRVRIVLEGGTNRIITSFPEY